MVIPNHNGDDSVKVLSYTRTDKTQAQAPVNKMPAEPFRNQLYSSSEEEQFTSDDESTVVDDLPVKQTGVTGTHVNNPPPPSYPISNRRLPFSVSLIIFFLIYSCLAGVQTGRDSIITKAKISPLRESVNLSDLSDEEVDRLTQLGLSFGPSKVTGQRLTQESQGKFYTIISMNNPQNIPTRRNTRFFK